MAKNATTHEEEKDLENLQSALSSTESFIEKNQKVLTIILCAILLIIAVWLLVENLYVLPKEDKANELIVAGQTYFQNGDYETAVNGDSISFDGFIAINKEYGFTKAGNLAAAYAGLAYYKMGNYDMALEYLNKFNGKDDVMKYTILGTIGDCYAQKGDAKKAVEYLLKAAKTDNILVAPVYKVKAGVAYESLGEYGKALDLYNEVKKDATPAQRGIPEVDDIDKYITSATIKNGK
ncbi:MAG: tetratricopeptide repeat protein [Paludibacteraceae bacterium]|jgi:tetratricopeptide (TPR) repeat protein|nr:tetratricopeptide repeat protein [Paludibacteraceae bacterium]